MSERPSIVLSCHAGTPVVLFGATELARQLGQIAEELLATGAEVELLAGIERAPARLVEAVKRTHTPGVFALCRRGDTPDPKLLKSLFDEAVTVPHRWIDCDVGEGTAAVLVPRIARELAELARPTDIAAVEPPVVAAVATEVSAVIALVRPTPPSTEVVVAPPRSRMIAAIPAIAAVAALAVGVSSWLGGTAVEPAPQVPEPPAPVVVPVAVGAPPIAAVPRRVEERAPPLVVAAPSVAAPSVPPPPAEPITIVEDERSQLERAIERKDVAVHRGLVVAPAIAGERRWHDAMTLCRARPFWFSHGWRVATRKELLTLARAELLPDAPVWSSTRADRRGTTAFIVHDGKPVAESKDEASALTVCVRQL